MYLRTSIALAGLIALTAPFAAYAKPPLPSTDPCKLVTRAEASKLMGVPSQAPKPHKFADEGLVQCILASADKTHTLTISATTATVAAQNHMSPSTAVGSQSVALGPGVIGAWSGNDLIIQKGSNNVEIVLTPSDPSPTATPNPGLSALAKVIASRM